MKKLSLLFILPLFLISCRQPDGINGRWKQIAGDREIIIISGDSKRKILTQENDKGGDGIVSELIKDDDSWVLGYWAVHAGLPVKKETRRQITVNGDRLKITEMRKGQSREYDKSDLGQ